MLTSGSTLPEKYDVRILGPVLPSSLRIIPYGAPGLEVTKNGSSTTLALAERRPHEAPESAEHALITRVPRLSVSHVTSPLTPVTVPDTPPRTDVDTLAEISI